jgi:transcriptional regulator with XRE-family HTH domain
MKLKELIKNKGTTMYQLAKDTGLGQGTICEIANGKRKHIQLETAMKISKALGERVEVIYKYIEED